MDQHETMELNTGTIRPGQAARGGAAFLRFAAAVLVALSAAWARGQGVAPVNPAFREWQKRRAAEQDGAGRRGRGARDPSEADEGFGLVPALVDMNYLSDINAGVAQAPAGGFPPSYDPRGENRLTPVKNQGMHGTCWAHAAMGSLESGILVHEGTAEDFSENNLVNLHGWDLGFDDGGNSEMAMAYFLRWDGPAEESEDPYPAPGESTPAAPSRHVQNVLFVPGKTDPYDNDAIKEAVLEHGALYVSYRHGYDYYNARTHAYYYPGTGLANSGHAVCVVGWDDEYPKENFVTKKTSAPAGDGAYLVRNSWGADWGDGGYYWVSYHDNFFAKSTMSAFCNAEPADNYGKVYQYDPLGEVGHFSAPWGANMFTAGAADKLAAVGFYALTPRTAYTLQIRTGCEAGKPGSGTLALTKSGTIAKPGYVTLPLDKPVPVAAGRRFAVILKLSTPGYSYPHAIEFAYTGYTSGANAAPGQSFFSETGSSWTDLTRWNTTANFCIKAYTEGAAPIELASLSVSGPATVKSGETAAYACTAKYSDGGEKAVEPAWSVVSGGDVASIAPDGTLAAGETATDRTVAIRAAYAEKGVEKTADWTLTVTAAPPPAPADLSATQGTETRAVRLSWTALPGVESYAVYRGETSSPSNAVHLGKAEAAKFSDTGALPGRDYWYFVKARNGSGTGPFSEGASGWRALEAPGGTEAADGTSTGAVRVTWAVVDGAAFYRVWGADSFDGDAVPVSGWLAATEWSDESTAPGEVRWYSVSAAPDASSARESARGIPDDGWRAVPVTPESLEIDGPGSLVSGGTANYSARVVYSDGSKGTNAIAPTWNVTRGSVSRTGAVTAPVVSENETIVLKATRTMDDARISGTKQVFVTANVPASPEGLRVVSATADAGVALAWDAVPDAAGYVLSRASPGGAEASFATSGTEFLDSTALPGVLFSYRVAAENAAGTSPRSAPVEARIPLAAPTGVTATDDRTDAVRVAWNAVAGAAAYQVARSAAEDGEKTELGDWTAARAFDDTAAGAGVAFWYSVRAAADADGTAPGPWSAPARGFRKAPAVVTRVDIAGPDAIPAGETALYACMATWSDGTSVRTPASWTLQGAGGAATVDSSGRVAAGHFAEDLRVILGAAFTNATGLHSAQKTVTLVAPAPATVEVTELSFIPRWPWNGLADIDYTLETSPEGTKARVALSARDRDHGADLPVATLSGDGAAGPVTAGRHRLTWDIGADYPEFHARAVTVSMTAVPSLLGAPGNLSASASTNAVVLSWTSDEHASRHEIFRAPASNPAERERIGETAATSWTDATGVAGLAYVYSVRSVSETGDTSDFATVTAKRVLAAPTGVALRSYSNDFPRIGWTASPGAASYRVRRRLNGDPETAAEIVAETTAVTFLDTGLVPGNQYYYRVAALSTGGGESDWSEEGAAHVRLRPPASFSASCGTTDAGVRLEWTPAEGASSYRLYKAPAAGDAALQFFAETADTGFLDETAVPGELTSYGIQTVPVNIPGILSSAVHAEGWRAHPAPVVSASNHVTGVFLSWTLPDGAESAEVWGAPTGSTNAEALLATVNGTNWHHTGGVAGKLWSYRVRTGGDCPGLFSASARGGKRPAEPVIESKPHVVGDAIASSWKTVTGASFYRVRKVAMGGPGVDSRTSFHDLQGLSWTDNDVEIGVLYYYAVQAVSADGIEGLWSDDWSASLPWDSQTTLTATQGTRADGILVEWDEVPHALAYRVYWLDAPASASNKWSQCREFAPGVTSCLFEDAAPGAIRYFSFGQVGAGIEIHSFIADPATGWRGLPAPAALAATSATGAVNLSWHAVEGAEGYEVYRAASADPAAAVCIASLAADGLSYSDATGEVAATYHYWVRALANGRPGAWSDSASAASRLAAPVMGGQTNGSTSVTITWSAVPGAARYRLFRYVCDESSSSAVVLAEPAGTSFVDSTAVRGYGYHYFARAIASNGTVGPRSSGYTRAYISGGTRANPANVSATDGTRDDGVLVTWTCPDPSGYHFSVYRSESGSSQKYLGQTEGFSYLDTTAVAGTPYVYEVHANPDRGNWWYAPCEAGDGGWRKPMDPSGDVHANSVGGFSASDGNSTAGVTLAWTAVGGAPKYWVYRWDAASNVWNSIGTTTGTSFVDTTGIPGVTHRYGAATADLGAAFGGNLSSDTGWRGLSPPTGISTSASDVNGQHRRTISWSAVPGAVSYEASLHQTTSSAAAETWSCDASDTSFYVTFDRQNATAYTRIRTIGAEGRASAWSEWVYLTW